MRQSCTDTWTRCINLTPLTLGNLVFKEECAALTSDQRSRGLQRISAGDVMSRLKFRWELLVLHRDYSYFHCGWSWSELCRSEPPRIRFRLFGPLKSSSSYPDSPGLLLFLLSLISIHFCFMWFLLAVSLGLISVSIQAVNTWTGVENLRVSIHLHSFSVTFMLLDCLIWLIFRCKTEGF